MYRHHTKKSHFYKIHTAPYPYKFLRDLYLQIIFTSIFTILFVWKDVNHPSSYDADTIRNEYGMVQ